MVIPVYDKNPLRRTAYVTYALIVLNIAIFALRPTAAGPGAPVRARAAPGRVVCTFPARPPKNPIVSVLTAALDRAGRLHPAGTAPAPSLVGGGNPLPYRYPQPPAD